ncbi:MAG: hypothetical protein H0T47_08630 [Planctomycetaceae bacterium]|nr:hypothetical protein [Planctomycetaceae bacterium]
MLLFDDEPTRKPDDDADFLERTCVTCRSDDITSVGSDMRKCNACGACMQKHAATGVWSRLASLYGGSKLKRRARRKVRR